MDLDSAIELYCRVPFIVTDDKARKGQWEQMGTEDQVQVLEDVQECISNRG